MLLRTRLTVYLSLAFLFVVAALATVGLRRESLIEERLASLAIVGQESVWERIVSESTAALKERAATLLGELARRPLPETNQAVRLWFDETGQKLIRDGTVLQVTDRAGRVIFNSEASVTDEPLLDAASLDDIVAHGSTVGGLQQTSKDNFMVLVGVPLARHGTVLGVLTLARDSSYDLRRFSRDIEAAAYLLSLRGRMVEGTSPFLWRQVQPTVPPRDPSFSTASTAGRRFTVTGVPVRDAGGRIAGTLVSLRDSSPELQEIRLLGLGSLALIGGFVIVLLTGLYFYLRRSFQPLDRAISVLRALSQGNTEVTLEAEGSDEIGRIAEAVSVFRANSITLAEQRRHSERQRRRQERLIRKQLAVLASTLEGGGRDEALEDMKRMLDRNSEPPQEIPGPVGRPLDEDEQLGLLAQVLQSMSSRITDQHRRLTQMVAELQEAIVTRTKLAGLQQELEIARRLQLSILPKALPPRDDVEVSGHMRPALEVGGDFYDFFLVEENKLGLVIADVSGKGVPAALFMAISRSLLKATAQSMKEPGATIDHVNAVLAEENEEMMFVTLFYAVLDLTSGRLTYVNAGHNPPYLRHRDGSLTALAQSGDIPVAVMEDFAFAVEAQDLAPGDLLLLYTDGVTEAFDKQEQAYGEARLEATLTALPAGAGSEATVKRLERSVAAFVAGAPQSDDLTMLVLKWNGPAD